MTHRLASVADADLVFVMDQGKLSESGSHDELLQRDGLYARLWRKQAGFVMQESGDGCTVTVERLKTISLLARLDDQKLAALAALFDTHQLGADRVVFEEGDPGDKFYLIARGKLVVSKLIDGAAKQFAVLCGGDFFGEIALLKNVARTATIKTVTPTVLLSLSRSDFLQTLADSPALLEELERVMTQRT